MVLNIRKAFCVILLLLSLEVHAQEKDHQLAVYHHSSGNLMEAGGHYVAALRAYEATLGIAHPIIAVIKEQMALYCMDICLFDEAIEYMNDALKIIDDYPEHLASLYNTIGRIYLQQRAFKRAGEWFQYASDSYPDDERFNVEKLFALKHLAMCHAFGKQYEDAKKALDKAVLIAGDESISKLIPTLNDIVTAWPKIDLAQKNVIWTARELTNTWLSPCFSLPFLFSIYYIKSGKSEEWTTLALQMVEVYNTWFKKSKLINPYNLFEYMLVLCNIGNICMAMEWYDEAKENLLAVITNYKEQIRSREVFWNYYFFQDFLGVGHLTREILPVTMDIASKTPLYNLMATKVYDLLQTMAYESVFLTGKEQTVFSKNFEEILLILDIVMYDVSKVKLLETILMQKNTVVNSQQLFHKARMTENEDLRNKYQQWKELKNDIIRTTLIGDIAREREKMIEAYCLEKFILRTAVLSTTLTSIEEACKVLSADEVVVEFFFNTSHWAPSLETGQVEKDDIVISASIWNNRSASPEIINLGNDSLLYKALNDDKFSPEDLYPAIWQPLEKKLSSYKYIYISAFPLFKYFTFGGMKTPHGYLCDKHEIYNIWSISDIPHIKERRNQHTVQNRTLTLFGGMDYFISQKRLANINNQLENNPNAVTHTLLRSMEPEERGTGFGYLENSLIEVLKIDSLFTANQWESTLFADFNATESKFKALSLSKSPRIIHISTHGFSFSIPQKADENIFKAAQDPMLRSGLAFTGANQIWSNNATLSGLDDGILTAYEVSNMNLQDTELVVLAACKSGLGSGSGYYELSHGLERAFRLAGVKSLLVSRKNVPDKETMDFMTLFYVSLAKGHPIHESFIHAQRAMRHQYPANPELWDGFVLIE